MSGHDLAVAELFREFNYTVNKIIFINMLYMYLLIINSDKVQKFYCTI
jgi:hypothetical protein